MQPLRAILLFAALTGADGAPAAEPAIPSAQQFWAGYDPRTEALEITIEKSWDEPKVHFDQLHFTGETWDGKPVRVFAYRAAPKEGAKLPGILHIHGGGQAASLPWVRFWAERGYVAVSHDFCGAGPGRAAETVTDWAGAPARMADPTGPRSSLHPTPQHNQWYHWILVARRALTLLEQHPQVDPTRLGVFGISVGGTLTWMIAGCDERVAAAAPIYGIGQNTYTFPWQSPEEPVDPDTRLTRAVLEPEGYAPLVKCPLLFLNASNDHHGRLDLGMRTLALATQSRMLREVYTPRALHHIGSAEAPDLALWMDFHLKGLGAVWPDAPKLEIRGGEMVPRLVIIVANPADVESVTCHYGLNNPWPTSRFYRAVAAAAAKSGDGSFTASAPFLQSGDTLYAFANVAYRSGIHLSTRLVKVPTATLPAVQPTLQRAAAIDPMDDNRGWFWWLAPTDPLHITPLLVPWTGPGGEHGFTHPPGAFSFATNVLGDPQFQNDGTSTLLLDVWAETLPASLEVTVATKFFQPGQTNYTTRPKLTKPDSPWLTLRLTPSDFHDAKGAALSHWKEVDWLCLSGAGDGAKQAVFKNLRWEVRE
jgi:dienelactone hydrolase